MSTASSDIAVTMNILQGSPGCKSCCKDECGNSLQFAGVTLPDKLTIDSNKIARLVKYNAFGQGETRYGWLVVCWHNCVQATCKYILEVKKMENNTLSLHCQRLAQAAATVPAQ